MITLDNLLQELVARTYASSSFGAQLDKMLFGMETHVTDPYQTLSNLENSLMHKAPVYRAIDNLTDIVKFAGNRYPKLRKLATRLDYNEGAVTVYVLRLWQEWQSTSQERALAVIYDWMNQHNKRPTQELRMEFAEGFMKKARKQSVDMYSDCLLAASDFLDEWNVKNGRKVRKII